MTKTSTVTEAVYKKYWDGEHGRMYTFNIRLANDDVGEINSKSEGGEKFNIGTEITYEITKGQFGNKIKIVQAQGAPSVQNNPIIQPTPGTSTIQIASPQPDSRNVSFALSYSKDLVVGKAISVVELFSMAYRIKNWMDNPSPDEKELLVRQEPQDKMEQFSQQRTPDQPGLYDELPPAMDSPY